MSNQPVPGDRLNTEGAVKWFDSRKGFGFIVGPNGEDIFVHYSVIQGDGFKALDDGTQVKYEAEFTPKGWRATAVSLSGGATDSSPEVVVRPQHQRTPSR
ncbi:MAG: cold shock domain-containing protein [Phycisphaeraceae bacterium]|nr:cold shock domain-containing protein [Phycisphaerales bacterium]MCB9861185.1 cold shock domain-containing protein [Phycisphaeraceae bacterium]